MVDGEPIQRPVQVFLDTRRFIGPPPPGRWGPSKDFFQGDNDGFQRHKARLQNQLQECATSLTDQNARLGFVIVQMREDALAKSYRPIGNLFAARNNFALVGGGDIGEMFFQATPEALYALDSLVSQRAEEAPEIKEDPKTGELVERVSGFRSELGAIARIRLPTPSDKLNFSAAEAVEAMQRKNALGGYIVELFRPEPAISAAAVQAQLEHFRRRLEALRGLVARPLGTAGKLDWSPLALSIDLTERIEDSEIILPSPAILEIQAGEEPEAPPRVAIARDRSLARHHLLLEQLSIEPMVRRILLPMEVAPAPTLQSGPSSPIEIPEPVPGREYPVVGIIDGGVADLPALQEWRAGAAGPITEEDRDDKHGTFIAGLASVGRVLNPNLASCLEREPCRFYDLTILPRDGLLQNYYATPEEFFDQLEELVVHAKARTGVRVFNLSIGAPRVRDRLGYSLFASYLDRISRDHDVIFVVSAGNLRGPEQRPEWPADTEAVLEMLAQRGGRDESIIAPAEHIYGLTVGAVNPPGLTTAIGGLPTVYTRRGPGAGGARKPELTHYGGAAQKPGNATGLVSFSADGTLMMGAGTSYAAPMVAATVASLDHRLGGNLARETLMALPVHRATRHKMMMEKSLRPIAREFVGFGVPCDAEDCLTDDPHSITLVFTDVLPPQRVLSFVFSWPPSLTSANGKCRGAVDITLAYSPLVDAAFDAESQRVQLAASLHQLNEKVTNDGEVISKPDSQLKHYDNDLSQNLDYTEKYLLESGLKWTPIKRYFREMIRGVGNRSEWRLSLKAETRAGAIIPDTGIGFSLLMTIRDTQGAAPIYDEVRAEVLRRGLRLADITATQRIRV